MTAPRGRRPGMCVTPLREGPGRASPPQVTATSRSAARGLRVSQMFVCDLETTSKPQRLHMLGRQTFFLKRPLPLNFRCLSEEQRRARPRSPFSSSLGPCPQDGLINWTSPKAGPAFHRALCVCVVGGSGVEGAEGVAVAAPPAALSQVTEERPQCPARQVP